MNRSGLNQVNLLPRRSFQLDPSMLVCLPICYRQIMATVTYTGVQSVHKHYVLFIYMYLQDMSSILPIMTVLLGNWMLLSSTYTIVQKGTLWVSFHQHANSEMNSKWATTDHSLHIYTCCCFSHIQHVIVADNLVWRSWDCKSQINWSSLFTTSQVRTYYSVCVWTWPHFIQVLSQCPMPNVRCCPMSAIICNWTPIITVALNIFCA